MSRPTVEVADILRAQGSRFCEQHRTWLSFQQLKVIRAITGCRTAALGGHIDVCTGCGYETGISYNSCRNRHCPKCQAQARQRWLEAREQELLETSYFHVVFTLPHQLNDLAAKNPRLLYNLLFAASAATLREVAADPNHLGARIGFLSILHTWGQNLRHHPHIHCVIPAGGLAPDHAHWIRPRYPFFLPVKVLSRVFRGKFIAGLRKAFRQDLLQFPGELRELAPQKRFAAFLRTLYRTDWVVYAKPAFGGPAQVLRYLGRYTHRVAISNHRLVAFDGEKVTFRWKDYAHGNKQRKMTLSVEEFLRRFLIHVLPRGFVRIRHFGFLANSQRGHLVSLSQRLLGNSPTVRLDGNGRSECMRWLCPRCRGTMMVSQRFSAVELSLDNNARCSYFDTS
jgi:putative transposase/transposase-like zinc-binding protein